MGFCSIVTLVSLNQPQAAVSVIANHNVDRAAGAAGEVEAGKE